MRFTAALHPIAVGQGSLKRVSNSLGQSKLTLVLHMCPGLQVGRSSDSYETLAGLRTENCLQWTWPHNPSSSPPHYLLPHLQVWLRAQIGLSASHPTIDEEWWMNMMMTCSAFVKQKITDNSGSILGPFWRFEEDLNDLFVVNVS